VIVSQEHTDRFGGHVSLDQAKADSTSKFEEI
jgi:hypothetical protein